MRKTTKKRFEEEYGKEYQEKEPESIIKYNIQNTFSYYEMEADVYKIKMQRKANEYKNLADEIRRNK